MARGWYRVTYPSDGVYDAMLIRGFDPDEVREEAVRLLRESGNVAVTRRQVRVYKVRGPVPKRYRVDTERQGNLFNTDSIERARIVARAYAFPVIVDRHTTGTVAA